MKEIDLNLLKNLEDKNIIVTGSGGMLGSAFQEILSKLEENKSLNNNTGSRFHYFDHKSLDITNRERVLSLVNLKPDIIIHCAAKVNADFCEKNPEECQNIQVQGTRNIKDLAKKCNAKILYPQSFLIFDGTTNPITETTTPNPLSMYGKYKYEAEKVLLEEPNNHLIVRMAGMFGGCERDKNFVGKFSRQLSEDISSGRTSIDVGDRIWQPTYTTDLAYNSLVLLSTNKSGLYNMSSLEKASFFELAVEIVNHFNLPVSINQISSKNFIEDAKRPLVALLDNTRLRFENLDFQRNWKETLNEYLDKPYFRTLFNKHSIVLRPYHHELLGDMKNRVVMSAMSRSFSDVNHLCTNDMMKYYESRAKNDIALIITEGAMVHQTADGYNNAPHMWSDAHAESWKKTVDAVHHFNTKIFCQLWHCGRISHEDYTGGVPPVSSTDKAAEGINRQNNKSYAKPRRLTKDEIPKIYDMFLNSGELALSAGFDGVELHFGHGYLIDQFFDSRINDRDDEYGGSIENRCRFAIELAELMIKKFGSDKVMVRISPSRDMNGTIDWPNLEEMIDYLMREFDNIGVRLLDISCARANYFETSGRVIRLTRKVWPHFIMGGASLSLIEAEKEIKKEYLDMVTWGRAIIANPNFVSKLKNSVTLIEFDREMLNKLE